MGRLVRCFLLSTAFGGGDGGHTRTVGQRGRAGLPVRVVVVVRRRDGALGWLAASDTTRAAGWATWSLRARISTGCAAEATAGRTPEAEQLDAKMDDDASMLPPIRSGHNSPIFAVAPTDIVGPGCAAPRSGPSRVDSNKVGRGSSSVPCEQVFLGKPGVFLVGLRGLSGQSRQRSQASRAGNQQRSPTATAVMTRAAGDGDCPADSSQRRTRSIGRARNRKRRASGAVAAIVNC